MKHLVYFTTARSDFGLFKPLLLSPFRDFHQTILSTGSHSIANSDSHQEVAEFAARNAIPHISIPFAPSDDLTQLSIINALSSSLIDVSATLLQLQPDMVVFLGDRWELYSAALSCLHLRIPLAHISGGEVTQGAIDDQIRHSLTSLSHLHFPSCSSHARNISLAGEEDWRITVAGESGLDSFYGFSPTPPETIFTQFGLSVPPATDLILFTYHPNTYGDDTQLSFHLQELETTFLQLQDFHILITGPGIEESSALVRSTLKRCAASMSHVSYVESLGRNNYLSLMHHSVLVLGNSSSGIVEAPSIPVASVNIGNRQSGRQSASSTLHCDITSASILQAIRFALSSEFQSSLSSTLNPYDPFQDGQNSNRISKALSTAINNFSRTKLLSKCYTNSVEPSKWSALINELSP